MRRQAAEGRRAAMRRRRLFLSAGVVGLVVAALAAATLTPGAGFSSSPRPGSVTLMQGSRLLGRVGLAPLTVDGRLVRSRVLSAVARRLPRSSVRRRGRATVRFRLDPRAAGLRAMRLGIEGGRVEVPARAVSATVSAPVVAQRLRNNCESAALQILLSTIGRKADQLRLQAELPHSGSLDPAGSGSAMTWGDPELGYVGRPEGGGAAGGFGVYQRPVAAAARRRGVGLRDLTDAAPGAVYARLLTGRAVMVWVGLSDGPYGEWRSPSGRSVKVNFGEHTVVLHGIRSDGSLEVSNPLYGTREVWGRKRFETMWERLGRRALST